ncbi:MAG: succinate dehydrogenase, cytochrome b556 subunit [Myxococcales bacterium]|nr:MAG: succinate dehydrogenase, cytochrome b556 subunit [Myxococcales bacterium]
MSHNAYLVRYKWRTGMLAWIGHRLSGLALIFYLSIHVFVTRAFFLAAKSQNPQAEFEKIYGVLTHPLFGLAEILLLAAVLYHALNGVRILIVDFGNGARYQKALWAGVMVVFVLLMLIFGGLMAAHVIGKMGGAA